MSESKENLPFSVARNIKVLVNKNIENLKSVQFDHNIMKTIKKIQIQDSNLVVAEANEVKQLLSFKNTVMVIKYISLYGSVSLVGLTPSQ